MYRYVFAVGKDVYCCWEYDLPERNNRFLSSIDGEYFDYVAHRHLDQIEGENRQHAAVALRAGYHHGLETLFSLLGALCQAPGAVPAWIPKCNNTALRELVEVLCRGGMVLTQAGSQRISLDDLAVLVHQYCWPDDQPAGATGERFGKLWHRFAADFLDTHHVAEYNSIKHGFRVSHGGFVLRVGIEEGYGIPAPEANMQTIGSSHFGTSFYEAIPILPDGSSKHHFRIRHRSLNWRAEAMVQRMQLLAWFINNVIGALRCLNGALPSTVRFCRPEEPTAFEAAWDWNVGTHTTNMDLVMDLALVDPIHRDDLRRELESRGR